MADPTFIKRAQPHSPLMTAGRSQHGLGSRGAFVATALILLAIFGATFFLNPDRPAAADDPAYYTWRTEALIANEPDVMLGITGPLDMYSSGYRVVTPVLGALIRQIADVGRLIPTIVIGVGLRVLIPLLLAGFAYRHRKDPLVWHAVAFASASLLVAPPFAGYLDNVMTLLFLVASLYFIEPSRTRWSARIAFFVLLLLSGLTHPTTLVIFCLVLGTMAVWRLVYRRLDLRSVLRDDAPMLVAAFLAALATYAIWKIGLWGPSASLGDAALPPPAGADFFAGRLNDWVTAMRPAFNVPLFLIGLVALLGLGRRVTEDELARVTVAWLAPLVGVLGVFAGLAYPYYRFFNTTLAWVLLIGLGAYFVARFFVDIASRGGVAMIALVGVVGIAWVLAGNFQTGLDRTGWNDPSDAWVKPDERAALDAVRVYLESEPAPAERAVVFVADDDADEEVRIYGFAKLVGNVSRYAVPGELQDRTAYYLGSVESFLDGSPTDDDPYHRELSEVSLEDARSVGAGPEDAPLIVVADVFNEAGSNAELFEGDPPSFGDAEVLVIAGGAVVSPADAQATSPSQAPPGTVGDVLRALLAAVLFLLPGLLLARLLLPGASLGETIGMVPVLGTSLLVLVAIVQLGVTGSPLTSGQAWLALSITTALSVVAFLAGGSTGGLRRNEGYPSAAP